MEEQTYKQVSEKLNINISKIKIVIKMLSEGSTIPFIARYRKEATGNLNEEELRNIETVYKYNVNLNERKEDIKRLINEKGMLTPELIKEIDASEKLSELEDIYLPFKEHKKTKGTEAIALGLEPLAKEIMEFTNKTKEELAKPYLNDKVKTIDDAITNAGYIIADNISNNTKYRKWIKDFYFKTGLVKSSKKKSAEDEKKLYEIYYDFEEPIKKIKSYRVLAISRAYKEKIVNYSLKVNDDKVLEYLEKDIIGNKIFPLKEEVKLFIKDAYDRLISPSIDREVKNELFENASDEGIKEFGDNLENLLLTPPIKETIVMGFDPAFRTGCKLAIVDKNGEVLDIGVIYPHEPKKLVNEAKKTVLELISKYNVKVIAIGNGTASRESESFISELINENKLDVKFVMVSEAGASVYSASPLAKKEFPDYSVEQRSAVSIARRLQDALSELVKIDPKSIGVGLYQHDLKQKELDEELSFVTSKIVNKVGVNLNTASESILSYVSGLTKKAITSILEYRRKKGKILERKELQKISGVTDKVFEQSAGFLRIIDGTNPLDKTNIHPEDYELVTNIAKEYSIDLNLVGSDKIKESLNNVDNNKVINTYNISLDKIETIKDNLINGIIDPRDEIEKMTLRSDVLTIDDLEEGMSLEGTIRNVLPFGAFVDIGLHDDALIHISKMSKDYVSHPSEIVKVGDIVKVYVDKIEKDKERVNLSLFKD